MGNNDMRRTRNIALLEPSGAHNPYASNHSEAVRFCSGPKNSKFKTGKVGYQDIQSSCANRV